MLLEEWANVRKDCQKMAGVSRDVGQGVQAHIEVSLICFMQRLEVKDMCGSRLPV